jgi:hypothetical protein
MKIQYTLPKGINIGTAGFSDSFEYNIHDGRSSGSGAKVTVRVNPVKVTSVTAWNGSALTSVVPSSRIIINGRHFGINAPSAAIAYTSGGVEKLLKLKVVSAGRYNGYTDSGRSYTDVDPASATYGESSVTVEIPSSWWKGWTAGAYTLVVSNGASEDRSVSLTLGFGSNTPPEARDDDITIYSGEGTPYYMIDVLADNGSGADSDDESHAVKVLFPSKTTTAGGKVSFDRKTGKVKYTRPKASPSTLAEFTDTFQYRLEDAAGAQSQTATVTLTVKTR